MACRYKYKGKIYEADQFADVLLSLPTSEAAKFMPDVDSLPNAPFVGKTQSWSLLAMKRMLRYAAENGFDSVAWTTGEQQAERYDLSQQVDAIQWTRLDNGRYQIQAEKDGSLLPVFDGDRIKVVTEQQLPNYVGKDAAEKIIASKTEDGDLTGDDLKVGMEGMIGFYDQMLPSVINKYVKKWGGRVGASKVFADSDRPADSTTDRGWNMETVHSLNITPAMRESVLRGQPLFTLQRNRKDWKIDPDDDMGTVFYKTIAQSDNAFMHAASDAKDVETIARDAGVKTKIEEHEYAYPKLMTRNDQVKREWKIYTDAKIKGLSGWNVLNADGNVVRTFGQEGFAKNYIKSLGADGTGYEAKYNDPKHITISETFDGKVFINLSELEAGTGMGSLYYHVAQNYAVNNGLEFVEDPAGVSDVATIRRTEAMLSSALKFGTTEHIHPSKSQMEQGARPLKWSDDEHVNLRELMKTSYANTVNYVPAIKNIVYNFDTHQFIDVATGKIHNDNTIEKLASETNELLRLEAERRLRARRPELSEADIARLAESPVFGSRTIKRAILFHSPSRRSRPFSRKEWTGLLERVRTELLAGDSVAEKLLYSLEDDITRAQQANLRKRQRAQERQGTYHHSDPPYVRRLKGAMLENDRVENGGKVPPPPQRGSDLNGDEKAEIFSHILRRLDPIRYQVQDKHIYLKRLQEELGVTPEEDAYLADTIWQGRAGERLDRFEENQIDPLLKKAAETGLEMAEIDEWLHARHAEEANSQLKEINPNRKDNEALSGMSDERAREILAQRKDNAALQEVGTVIDKINAERVKLMVDEGLITQDTANIWWANYKHYVPLKRAETDELLPPRGRGFDVVGPESKRRIGSNRAVENVLANVLAQYEASVVRAEKNKVVTALFKFAEANPRPEWWEVDKQKKVAAVKDGEVKWYNDPRAYDNEIHAKIDGEIHTVRFNAQNPEAMKIVSAMKNLEQINLGNIVRVLMGVNRFLSALNTSWSPEFVISNFTRDLQTAGYNLTSTELKGFEKDVIKSVPGALRGLRANLRKGEKGGEWTGWAERFRLAGGKTGWIDNYKDILQRRHKLEKAMKRMQSGKPRRTWMQEVVKFVEDYNTVVENGVRLAAFRKAVERGFTEQQAAGLAKELTVNFNRKGMAGPVLNAMYLFYNASIQGITRMMETLVKSSRGRKMVAATIGFAIALDILNRSLAGDDDDGENLYDAVPDHVKNRNLILMGEKQPIFKFPLPWGYNVFHVLGQEVGQLMTGDTFDPLDSAMRFGSAFADAFNPIGSGTFLQMASPTILDPAVQIGENKNWTGQPLMPEGSPFGPAVPKSELYWSSSREVSKQIAQKLNAWSGGDPVRPGAIDISSEWIDVFVDTFTGSAGRVAADSFNFAHKAVTGKELQTNEIPMLRKVYGYDNKYALQSRFFEYSEDVQYTARQIKEFTGQERLRARNTPQAKLIAMEKAVSSRLRRIRQRLRLAKENGDDQQIERYEEMMRREMARFNRAYAERVMER